MLIIGCDFHPTFQQIAFTDTETGEYGERRLYHPQEAEQFYRGLAGGKVRVGMEATGSFRWFRRLLDELGHELWLGNPTEIRASAPRRQKTDKRDARQLLQLLLEQRFPQVWLATVADEELRQLLLHRCRLVRLRTKVRNQLDAIAKNEGLVGQRVGTLKGRRQLEALPLSGWYQKRRQDLFELLDQLERRIAPLHQAVQQAAEQRADWKTVLRGLLERGLRRVLIVVHDDFSGLLPITQSLFPGSDVQLCAVHMQRNAKTHLPKADAGEFQQRWRAIKSCWNLELAHQQFEELCDRFTQTSSSFIAELRKKRPHYLAFLSFPESIRRSFSTTNAVEAINGQLEIMRRNSGGYFYSEDTLKLKLGLAISSLEEGRWRSPGRTTSAVLHQLNAMFQSRFEANV